MALSHERFFSGDTGRNEVLAKVIFSQACVKNSVHRGGGCGLVPGGGRVSPIFSGGGVGVVWSRGFSKIFGEGLQFFWGLQFFGEGDTVNVRPVNVLLECILVFICYCYFAWWFFSMYGHFVPPHRERRECHVILLDCHLIKYSCAVLFLSQLYWSFIYALKYIFT